MKMIQLPTALVMVSFLAAYVVLTALGHEVPGWLLGVVAAIGTSATAVMHKLFPDGPKPPPDGPSVVEDIAPPSASTIRPPSRDGLSMAGEDDEEVPTPRYEDADTLPGFDVAAIPGFQLTGLALVAGVVFAAACMTGCSRPPSGPDAALLREAGQHQLELDACLIKAKQGSGKYSEYEVCKDAVELRFGLTITDAGAQ